MISDAIIRTITRWLPTLDEARLREVEDFVLAKAIEQQDEAHRAAAQQRFVDFANGLPDPGTSLLATLSAPADTVVPHDGKRTHGGNCQGGETVDAPAIDPLVPNNDRQDTGAPRPVEFVGRAGSSPAPDTRPEPGDETPTGGTFTVAEFSADAARVVAHAAKTGRAVVVRPDGSVRVAISIPAAEHRVNAGLRELRDATPEPGLNSASMWRPEVDGRFDDGGES